MPHYDVSMRYACARRRVPYHLCVCGRNVCPYKIHEAHLCNKTKGQKVIDKAAYVTKQRIYLSGGKECVRLHTVSSHSPQNLRETRKIKHIIKKIQRNTAVSLDCDRNVNDFYARFPLLHG